VTQSAVDMRRLAATALLAVISALSALIAVVPEAQDNWLRARSAICNLDALHRIRIPWWPDVRPLEQLCDLVR
jgi:hypothetical protein